MKTMKLQIQHRSFYFLPFRSDQISRSVSVVDYLFSFVGHSSLEKNSPLCWVSAGAVSGPARPPAALSPCQPVPRRLLPHSWPPVSPSGLPLSGAETHAHTLLVLSSGFPPHCFTSCVFSRMA